MTQVIIIAVKKCGSDLPGIYFNKYSTNLHACNVSVTRKNNLLKEVKKTKGAVTLGNFSCNLSRNFVVTQVISDISELYLLSVIKTSVFSTVVAALL